MQSARSGKSALKLAAKLPSEQAASVRRIPAVFAESLAFQFLRPRDAPLSDVLALLVL